MNELHLGACQFNDIPIFERNRIGTDRGAVDCGVAATFNVMHNKPLMPLGDGCHGNSGFANGRYDFGKRYFSPCSRARQYLDGRMESTQPHRVAATRGPKCRYNAGSSLGRARLGYHGLVKIVGSAVANELDFVLADLNIVVALQLLTLDGLALT